MISKQGVKYIAKLARLGLTQKEIEKFRKELSKILDYIEKLKEVDISGAEPTSHSVLIENIMREDKSQKPALYRTKGSGAGLMELAPEIKKGYLKVKSIL